MAAAGHRGGWPAHGRARCRWSWPKWAAAGIGTLWSLWHLPLSFIEGSYYYELGAGSLRFWLTHLMLVQLGVLLVWLANGSGGSILLAVLAHAAFNVAVGLARAMRPSTWWPFSLSAATSAVITVTGGRLCFPADDATAQPSSIERRRSIRTPPSVPFPLQ
jgi:uncharacterized protein